MCTTTELRHIHLIILIKKKSRGSFCSPLNHGEIPFMEFPPLLFDF